MTFARVFGDVLFGFFICLGIWKLAEIIDLLVTRSS